MRDLIDRQAILDIVLEYAQRLYEPVGTQEDNEMYSFGRGLLLSIERNVKDLPSAQMDSTCVGCRYERKGSVVCDDCSRFFMDRYERREENG